MIFTPDDRSRYVAVKRWTGTYTSVDTAASYIADNVYHATCYEIMTRIFSEIVTSQFSSRNMMYMNGILNACKSQLQTSWIKA
jgi:hypothetical protein